MDCIEILATRRHDQFSPPKRRSTADIGAGIQRVSKGFPSEVLVHTEGRGALIESTSADALMLHYNFDPPSTRKVWPVIHRALSEAKKAMTGPMSSGLATRFIACIPKV